MKSNFTLQSNYDSYRIILKNYNMGLLSKIFVNEEDKDLKYVLFAGFSSSHEIQMEKEQLRSTIRL